MKQITITVDDDWYEAAAELYRDSGHTVDIVVRHAASYWLAEFTRDLLIKTLKRDVADSESKKHVQMVMVEEYANMEIALDKGLIGDQGRDSVSPEEGHSDT